MNIVLLLVGLRAPPRPAAGAGRRHGGKYYSAYKQNNQTFKVQPGRGPE